MKESALEDVSRKRELSDEEKKILKSFDQIPFHSPRSKADTLLVWRKLKNGTNIWLNSGTTLEQVAKMREVMTRAGIYSKFVKREKPKSGDAAEMLFIANNPNDLALLSELFFGDHLNDPRVYRELGRIFGYPATAVEAFDKSRQLGKEEGKKYRLEMSEIEEKLKPENIPEVFFILSREHWDTEVALMKKWMDEIKFLDPVLYEEINSSKDDGGGH